MNREIKFRARNNKCWIYCGAIINDWAILNKNGGMAKINPETVRTIHTDYTIKTEKRYTREI